jgi:rod shape determining protein RodA
VSKGVGIALPRSQIGVSRWRRFRASIDLPLVFCVIAIAAIGLLNLYSATHGTRNSNKFDKQITRMMIGVAAFVILTIVDYRTWVRLAWVILAGSVLSLVLVLILGATIKGGQRWFDLGSFPVQPSEPAKIALILVIARMFQDGDFDRLPPRDLALRVMALGVPVFLVAIQPDLGTSILLILIAMTIGFMMMTNLWRMVYATLVGLLLIPILWEKMEGYQRNRVMCFLDYEADPNGVCWHTRQSIYAVGSGKVLGKGYMEGTQNRFDYLPEHWTDFPFSVWAEEWGFAGSAFVILLYSFLTLWILNIALTARDKAGAAICIGVAAMTFWHVAVNVAMVLGMAPVVGVTLPLISYGGTSVITFLAAMGLVASVSLRKHGY